MNTDRVSIDFVCSHCPCFSGYIACWSTSYSYRACCRRLATSSVSHAGGAGTGIATGTGATGSIVPDPEAGLGTGTGEDASICCRRRLGCNTLRGLNLKKRDEREKR